MSTITNSISETGRPRWFVKKRTSHDLLEHLCAIRSITADELSLDYERHLFDPFLLPDMEKACQVFIECVKNKGSVTIFGDYDADGTPASALLSLAFEALGVAHKVVLPTRETGYGLRLADVEAAAKDSNLLITVDTGITAVTEVGRAKELGLKVIILDHHLPTKKLPPADAVVDTYVTSSKYPFSNLCGCALAFKFVEALSKEYPEQLTVTFRKWLLDLVAISTVADMMVMRSENRALVHYGLKVLRKNKRIGISALLKVAGIEPETVDAGTIGYAIGPRFNASGRLGDNRVVYDLLTSKDPTVATELAKEIESANRERQTLVESLMETIDKIVFEQNSRSDKFFVIHGDNWPSGVLGLAAGKIAGRYNRPVVVLTKIGDQYSGSGRSPDNYSLIGALESQAKSLSRFGGHRTAAGLSLTVDNLPKFVDGIKSHAAAAITEEDLLQRYNADAILDSSDISLETIRRINQLEPFGLQNPQPQFIIRNVEIEALKRIGRQASHIKTVGRIDGIRFDVIGFNLAKVHDHFGDHNLIDCLGHLEENVWQGRRSLQLRLVDYHPAGKDIDEI